MKDVDWNAEAARAARYISEHMMESHRGACAWGAHGVVVLYGNDGIKDPRYVGERAAVRRMLAEDGIPVLGEGVCGEGYTWTILARGEDIVWFHTLVWEAFVEALEEGPTDPAGWGGYLHCQMGISECYIYDAPNRLPSST
jgi:hypothetical protein